MLSGTKSRVIVLICVRDSGVKKIGGGAVKHAEICANEALVLEWRNGF